MRTIRAVEKLFSSSFAAVPALSRVEPVTASGPVSAHTQTVAATASGAAGLAVIRAVKAPDRWAWARAAPT